MGLLSGNSCNIITILPLGLNCSSIDASTPDATNGVIALYVTGGTPPYNITWNNGLQGSPLSNLSPGNYTATVTDYYGDFTATTTCTVGSESFYLEKFEDCSNSGNYVYYLANLPSSFSSGKVYNLTTQSGCWTSSGTTLYSGETYYNYFATTNYSAYTDCNSCLPPPIPPVVYPQNLCMTITNNNAPYTTQQINFSSGNTINGYPSWTSSTSSYTMYYNTGMTRWELLNWVGIGLPSFNFPSAPPIGGWSVNGFNNTSVSVVSGICTTPPLILNVNRTNPSCVGVNNGVINATASGGVPPYTFSLDGVNYGGGNFVGLSQGTYTVYVKDSVNTITTQTAILTPQASLSNYNINLTLTPAAVETNVGTNKTKTWYFRVDTSPVLLPTQTVTFNLNFAVNMSGNTLAPIVTTQVNTINITTNGTSTVSSATTNPSTISPLVQVGVPCFRDIYKGTTAYTTSYVGTITGSGYLTGTVTQSITTPTISYEYICPLRGTIKDSISMTPISLNPSTCSLLDNTVDTLTLMLDKIGMTN